MRRRGLVRSLRPVLLGITAGLLSWTLFCIAFPRVGAESIFQLVQLTDQAGDRVTTTGGAVPVSLGHYCQPLGFHITTATQLVTPSGSQAVYLCGMLLFEAASETFSFVQGSGTLCASNQQPVAGGQNGIVGTMAIVANGGFSIAFAIPVQLSSGNGVCAFKSTTGSSDGALYYAQY